MLVKKKNGEYLDVCGLSLNKFLARDNYFLPLIEDQLLILNNKKYFIG